MASRISCGGDLLVAGVKSVRPMLAGFLLGGEAGFTKAEDGNGSMVLACAAVAAGTGSAGNIGGGGRSGKLVVEDARAWCRAVLTARFLRLRPFLGGGCFCNSKNGA